MAEARLMARDALNLMLMHTADRCDPIPAPVEIKPVPCGDGEAVSLARADTTKYKEIRIMELSHNKELVRGIFEEFFNHHDISAADRYLHPDYVQHDFDVPPGREGFKEHFTRVFAMFPQFRVEIHHIIEEGDMVVMHGYGVTDPGKIEVLVVDIYRVRDGLLFEHWGTVQPLPQAQFGNPRLL